jgi:orotidine-5'-phosphate decarboxylase
MKVWESDGQLSLLELLKADPEVTAALSAADLEKFNLDYHFKAIDTIFARVVKGHVGGLKLGLEFFCAHGHHGVHEVAKVGLPLFLDLKLHDIPNTVAGAMQSIHVLEPAIVTVHASGGRAMMEDAKAAAGEHCKVVAVTVLTSLDDTDLNGMGVGGGSRSGAASGRSGAGGRA